MGIILDTTEIIAAERRRRSVLDLIALYEPGEPLAISSVTVAELRHGVMRAKDPTRLQYRQKIFTDVLSSISIVAVSTEIAILIGELDAELVTAGRRLPFPDIAVAATAIHLDFELVTANVSDFERIPRLRLRPSPLSS